MMIPLGLVTLHGRAFDIRVSEIARRLKCSQCGCVEVRIANDPEALQVVMRGEPQPAGNEWRKATVGSAAAHGGRLLAHLVRRVSARRHRQR
jgi:hypothetical protein